LKFNYGVSFQRVREITNETLVSCNGILKEPIHYVGVSSLDPDGYKIMINVWTQTNTYRDTRYSLQEKIMESLKTAGIKLPGT
jgi:small conductance mechanosensitive channel